MTIWNITIQNNATKDLSTIRLPNISESELYLKFSFSGETAQSWLEKQADGEWTYYVWPMSSSGNTEWINDYNNGGSTVLDSDVVNQVTGERVQIRDLNPIIGILRIGNPPEVTDNEYDNNKWKTYYYDN